MCNSPFLLSLSGARFFFFERGRGAFDSFRLYTHVNKVGECRWNSEH